MSLKNISLIVPCYNEEKIISNCINALVENTNKITKYNFEIIIIDDGSDDKSEDIIKNIIRTHGSSKKIKYIKLSKNYGFHIAVTAGLDSIQNTDAAIIIPADDYYLSMQINEMIEKKISSNAEIIWSLRKDYKSNFFKNLFRILFYKLFIFFSGLKNYPKEGVSAFFMISSKIIQNFLKFKETNRNINILIFTMGFKQSFIYYHREKEIRNSKYNFLSKLKLAIDSFISYSYTPIRLISLIGITISLLSFIYLFYIIIDYFFYGSSVPGWSSLIIIVLFLGGIQLITLGFLGEYVSRISNETKKNPLYLVDYKKGF